MLTHDPHPLADLYAFISMFPRELAEMPTPATILQLLRLDAPVSIRSNDSIREAVRALLRHGGFKPTGRSKPASEYLLKAVGDGSLSSINLAVDICNVVSLHSGLPISVIDLDKSTGPHRTGIAPAGSQYVFNQAGQVIDLSGLLCLFDADGPCACAVKDSQRTKTSPTTKRTLSIIWGTKSLPSRTKETALFYYELIRSAGVDVSVV